MKKEIARTAIIGLVAWSSILISVAQQTSSNPPASSNPTPQAKPNPLPQDKAMHPAPSANAQGKTQKNSVGNGALTETTQQLDDFWQEQISSGGAMVTTDFLYDPTLGVVYGYRQDNFACANGSTANGGVLEAMWTSGNKSGKPAGSGWYAVELNGSKCGVNASGIYGCKVDASGNPTRCGTAVINNSTGDIDIATAQ